MDSVDNPYFLMEAMPGEKSGEGTDLRRSIEELKDHLASMVGLWAKSDSEKQLLLGRIEELEAKLTECEARLEKAVETLEYYNVAGYEGKEARTTLAELKGQNDE